jgi:hypothetical protein
VDCPLTNLIAKTAQVWLATSASFEPSFPILRQNAILGLALLKNLGTITQVSFQVEPISPKMTTKENQQLKDAPLIEALMELRNSNRLFSRTPGIYHSILRPRTL